MSKEILSTNGQKLGEITLSKEVFGVEPNIHVMKKVQVVQEQVHFVLHCLQAVV